MKQALKPNGYHEAARTVQDIASGDETAVARLADDLREAVEGSIAKSEKRIKAHTDETAKMILESTEDLKKEMAKSTKNMEQNVLTIASAVRRMDGGGPTQ